MLRNYIATLHERPEHHVKRFSLVVSGCFTLLIFALWLNFKFGASAPQAVAQAPADESAITAESPLASMRASAADAWALVTGEVQKAATGLQSVDIENNYTQVRNDALNNN